MSQANQADFFGEGTNGSVGAPVRTPEQIKRDQELARQRAAAQAQRARLDSANLASRGRQNLLNSGQKQATTAPIQWGPGARSAAELQAMAAGASDAANKRSGGFLGDLGRLGTAGLRTVYGTGIDTGLDALGVGEVPRAIADTPGYFARAGIDEGADQVIPGGSGAYGSNLVPGVKGTGGDAFYPSETLQSGSYSDGYRGVGNARASAGSGVSGAPIGGTPQYTNQNGGALSAEAQRILGSAGQMAQASQAQANTFYGQAAQASTRAAPQIQAPSSGQMDAVYDRAMNFNAYSGADRILAERADTSGAGRLEGMQMDQQGINNLEGFRSDNTAQGVNALYGFRPDETFRSASELAAFYAQNTAEGANAVAGFRPTMVQEDAQALRSFQADRSGINRLNAYADAPEGPSAAQAMLRGQADADKRTQLAIARSGRGGPASAVQAQRQASAEGGLIMAETRGQAATLRAQETDAYKNRQLQALAQAGSLISQAEAQRLTAMSNAGQLMSAADAQKLSALQAYGQLKATQDSQQLSAKQSAGQLTSNAEGMLLNATSNAAQLQGQMDQQRLSAINAAAGYRTQGDQIRSSNLQAAGNIRLQGSEINQRGAIAASNADLQAQALNLQSLSLAGNISTNIRSQNIDVLKSNLSSELQTLGLNDQQVRFFSQMASDREVASQNLSMQANSMGANLEQAQQALDLQWAQFGYNQLTTNQQLQMRQQQQQIENSQANRNFGLNAAGTALTGIGMLMGRGGGGGGGGQPAPSSAYAPPLPPVPSYQLSMPQVGYQNVGNSGGGYGQAAPAGLGQLPNGGQLTMPTYQTPYAQQYGQPSEVSY